MRIRIGPVIHLLPQFTLLFIYFRLFSIFLTSIFAELSPKLMTLSLKLMFLKQKKWQVRIK